MKRTGDPVRRFVSMGVVTLMLAVSVAVPLMERDELVPEPVAESEHNPATCPPAHDHRVCTQVSANLAVASVSQERTLPKGAVLQLAPVGQAAVPPAGLSDGNRSRAPPLG